MKKIISLNNDWVFCKQGVKETVNLPHTWNGLDGQGAESSYYKGKCTYTKVIPQYPGKVFLEFKGANSVCSVLVNGRNAGRHEGGYSTFRFEITDLLTSPKNFLEVTVDNSENKAVYPQMADFTFYGGLYRDVNLIYDVPETHFSLTDAGSKGVYITAKTDGTVQVKALISGYKTGISVLYEVLDSEGKVVAKAGDRTKLKVENPILWNGLENPYLYTLRASILDMGKTLDNATLKFGFRDITFKEDGCYLNGKHIKLKGVSRHQDRETVGNALTMAHHEKDLAIIKEMGANSLRLAHYQQSGDFYDLCDETGMLVWAEIPVISRFNKKAQENALNQLEELIKQNMHHASIFCWGIQNEITISSENETLIDGIKELNQYAKLLDSSRPTTCAQFSMCSPSSELNSITDILGYNHYFGWYMKTCNGLDEWLEKFRKVNPKGTLCLSEYGAEGVLGYFSDKPSQGDYSEGYQAIFHEHYIKTINAHDYLWGSYVWNMFDFGSAMRNEGGVRGRNNKGLVTFDRKQKKDAFYLYKAFWSDEKFLHLVGSRYDKRTIGTHQFKVYSNCDKVTLKVGSKQKTVTAKGIFIFDDMEIKEGENKVTVTSGDLKESFTFEGVTEYPREYSLPDGCSSMVRNWFVEKDESESAASGEYFSLDDTVGELLKNEDIVGMVSGVAGKIIKSPLMAIVKPFTLRQLLSLKFINVDPSMIEMAEQYLSTVKKNK
ncbi:MAG: glycoside hydrolase family 2 protein [Acutalibacteraceae bacterium]